jgi:hypothetical protein
VSLIDGLATDSKPEKTILSLSQQTAIISIATLTMPSSPQAPFNLKPINNPPNTKTSFILDNLDFISFIFPISPLQDTENYKQQFPSQTALSFNYFVFQTCFKESKLCRDISEISLTRD